MQLNERSEPVGQPTAVKCYTEAGDISVFDGSASAKTLYTPRVPAKAQALKVGQSIVL